MCKNRQIVSNNHDINFEKIMNRNNWNQTQKKK